ncbi:4'-phosphopantetheinyl transferase family protein [Hymenobacter actinosclerus]|uniref:4'-phosphopantetheinyl transferase n=1 Tax=Hymenobacter actinosclerus TaxID=82805 RepID=A0A1I0IKN0_9BACT|nr:4'-phosphopantetheinyl transferase superfamily protein [Hymenobacter actinosclerus]SET96831.1 4'-phosphopantetheinyl transferase [Hymenobacter actinosclerus]
MMLYASLHFPERLAGPVFAALLQALPPPLRQEALRFHRWQDQHAALLGKLLVKHLLLRCGYPADTLQSLYRDALGKPRLPLPVDFSISHAGTLVACALSTSHRVGLDVEQVQSYALEDFQHFLRPDEQQLLAKAGMGWAFCELWTQKESFLKAKGVGLVSALRLQDVYVQAKGCRYQPATGPSEQWYYFPLPTPAGYVASLCTQVPGLRIESVLTTVTTLLQEAEHNHLSTITSTRVSTQCPDAIPSNC